MATITFTTHGRIQRIEIADTTTVVTEQPHPNIQDGEHAPLLGRATVTHRLISTYPITFNESESDQMTFLLQACRILQGTGARPSEQARSIQNRAVPFQNLLNQFDEDFSQRTQEYKTAWENAVSTDLSILEPLATASKVSLCCGSSSLVKDGCSNRKTCLIRMEGSEALRELAIRNRVGKRCLELLNTLHPQSGTSPINQATHDAVEELFQLVSCYQTGLSASVYQTIGLFNFHDRFTDLTSEAQRNFNPCLFQEIYQLSQLHTLVQAPAHNISRVSTILAQANLFETSFKQLIEVLSSRQEVPLSLHHWETLNTLNKLRSAYRAIFARQATSPQLSSLLQDAEKHVTDGRPWMQDLHTLVRKLQDLEPTCSMMETRTEEFGNSFEELSARFVIFKKMPFQTLDTSTIDSVHQIEAVLANLHPFIERFTLLMAHIERAADPSLFRDYAISLAKLDKLFSVYTKVTNNSTLYIGRTEINTWLLREKEAKQIQFEDQIRTLSTSLQGIETGEKEISTDTVEKLRDILLAYKSLFPKGALQVDEQLVAKESFLRRFQTLLPILQETATKQISLGKGVCTIHQEKSSQLRQTFEEASRLYAGYQNIFPNEYSALESAGIPKLLKEDTTIFAERFSLLVTAMKTIHEHNTDDFGTIFEELFLLKETYRKVFQQNIPNQDVAAALATPALFLPKFQYLIALNAPLSKLTTRSETRAESPTFSTTSLNQSVFSLDTAAFSSSRNTKDRIKDLHTAYKHVFGSDENPEAKELCEAIDKLKISGYYRNK